MTGIGTNAGQLVDWWRQMLTIRLFEEKVQELYLQGLVPGTTHLCQGQEAVSVGAIAALEPEDFLTITYRGHGQALARGMDIERAFAEIMGRQTGICRGFGGSMHLTDVSHGLLGAFAIVGAGLPVAVGAATAAQLRGESRVAMAFFGDGAVNIGTFHEALNIASVWKAPVVFVCENNLYGEFSPVRHTTPMDDLSDRATAYAMPGESVDGQDVEAVYARTAEAVTRARSGAGPTLLEMKTYRYRGHSRSDPARYRPAGELELWRTRDPIDLLGQKLHESGALKSDEQAGLGKEVQQEIDAAADRAAQAAWPDPAEDILRCVYSFTRTHRGDGGHDGVEQLTYRDAICAAMSDEMREDPSVLLLGEDVGPQGGPFKTSDGLLEAFGPRRVIDTPIAENGFLGVALGMAVTGLRPIAEIMFSDFLPVAGDALVNEIPKFRLMSGGQTAVPLVIRSIGGATGYFGTQHSATGESWLLQVPGLRVVTAATPAAAYGLLRTAIRMDDPVLFIEHRGLYTRKGPVDRAEPLPEIGAAAVLRSGSDVTLVATLLMVERATRAAELLAGEGIQVEVIDLRWLNPLDVETVANSIARTGRLVIAEEQPHPAGWGATLISELTMRGTVWRSLPRPVSLPYLPTPFSPPLEDAAVPSVDRIASAIREVCSA